MAPFQHHDFQ
jgi:katanin p60 ATPase-containing subunit A1